LRVRRPLVAGNWKMNGSAASIATLMAGVVAGVEGLEKTDVSVCPPFPYLAAVGERVRGTRVTLGAQDCSVHEAGAYTGEVAAPMLIDVGCRQVIVGHSERRQYHAETDELVARKFARALQSGLMPILCVGETLQEREQGQTEAVVGRQLAAVLGNSGIAAFGNAVIAYEPVWAIGTGKVATPEQAQAVHAFIRGRLTEADGTVAAATRILYGGSVKGSNAAELFRQPDIDGGLIGGASLQADEFITICRAAG
jgi:triosephosphate isomerase